MRSTFDRANVKKMNEVAWAESARLCHIAQKNDTQMRTAAIALLLDGKGNVMSLARKGNENDISLPGGKAENEDDSIFITCRREMREEAAVEIQTPTADDLIFVRVENDLLCYTFLVRTEDDALPNDDVYETHEGTACWRPIDTLMGPKCLYANHNTKVVQGLFGDVEDASEADHLADVAEQLSEDAVQMVMHDVGSINTSAELHKAATSLGFDANELSKLLRKLMKQQARDIRNNPWRSNVAIMSSGDEEDDAAPKTLPEGEEQ